MIYAVISLLLAQTFITALPTTTVQDSLNGINEFSLRLLDNIATEKEDNFVVSSVSVWNLFALLSEAASGLTFDELSLQLNLPKNQKHTKDLYISTNDVLSKNYTEVSLKRLGSVYVDMNLKLHQDFAVLASRTYNSIVREVDTTDLQNVSDIINYDVCVATDGQISDIVKKDVLENLKVILIDAVHFKAKWTTGFEAKFTKEEAFYDDRGRKIGSVNMMYQESNNSVAYMNDISAQVLEITYGPDKKFSLIFLIPYDGISLKRLVKNLSKSSIKRVFDALKRSPLIEVECYVPRFKISSELNLIQPLKYMGINEIFETDRASLPGISDTPLFVSKVLQKAEIEVNEEGTVAAATTVVGLEERISGMRVEVNKPFVYMIAERESNLVLFSGVYSIPSLA